MINIQMAYIHHASPAIKQAAIKKAETTYTYEGATEQGRIPAAIMLAALTGGLGAGGAALLSKQNKGRNALIAGLLGAAAGGAGGYYGAGLPTGLKLRNTDLDPTMRTGISYVDDLLSGGNADSDSLTLGQLGLGVQNYLGNAYDSARNYVADKTGL